jgi:excisionase family DNA binding protein
MTCFIQASYESFLFLKLGGAHLVPKVRLNQSNPMEFMEKLLKVEQVAELLQVSKRTIYDWTHVGYIPHYKLPNGVRFKESEVNKWVQRRFRKGRVGYYLIHSC